MFASYSFARGGSTKLERMRSGVRIETASDIDFAAHAAQE